MEHCFLPSSPCLYVHVRALLKNKDSYLSTLDALCRKGLINTTSQAVKARAIAALQIAGQHEHLQLLLPHCDAVDIARVLTMLDSPRRTRQLERKIQKIEEQYPHLTDTKVEDTAVKVHRRSQRAKHPRGSKHRTTATQDDVTALRRRRRHPGIRRLRRQLCEVAASGDSNHTNSVCEKAHADSAVAELINSSSVSGALANKIRDWARSTSSSSSS